MNIPTTLTRLMQAGVMATVPGDLPLSQITLVGDALLAAPVVAVRVPHLGQTAVSLFRDLRRRAEGNMVLGMSGVDTAVQAEEAIEAEAKFVMSRQLDRQIAALCQAAGVLYIPEVISLLAAHAAVQAGVTMVNIQTGGPQGPLFIRRVRETVPSLSVAVSGPFSPPDVTAYAQAEAALFVADGQIVADAQQPMAEIIKRARAFQQAWDLGQQERAENGRFSLN